MVYLLTPLPLKTSAEARHPFFARTQTPKQPALAKITRKNQKPRHLSAFCITSRFLSPSTLAGTFTPELKSLKTGIFLHNTRLRNPGHKRNLFIKDPKIYGRSPFLGVGNACFTTSPNFRP